MKESRYKTGAPYQQSRAVLRDIYGSRSIDGSAPQADPSKNIGAGGTSNSAWADIFKGNTGANTQAAALASRLVSKDPNPTRNISSSVVSQMTPQTPRVLSPESTSLFSGAWSSKFDPSMLLRPNSGIPAAPPIASNGNTSWTDTVISGRAGGKAGEQYLGSRNQYFGSPEHPTVPQLAGQSRYGDVIESKYGIGSVSAPPSASLGTQSIGGGVQNHSLPSISDMAAPAVDYSSIWQRAATMKKPNPLSSTLSPAPLSSMLSPRPQASAPRAPKAQFPDYGRAYDAGAKKGQWSNLFRSFADSLKF